jgi:hypothetical protein
MAFVTRNIFVIHKPVHLRIYSLCTINICHFSQFIYFNNALVCCFCLFGINKCDIFLQFDKYQKLYIQSELLMVDGGSTRNM